MECTGAAAPVSARRSGSFVPLCRASRRRASIGAVRPATIASISASANGKRPTRSRSGSIVRRQWVSSPPRAPVEERPCARSRPRRGRSSGAWRRAGEPSRPDTAARVAQHRRAFRRGHADRGARAGYTAAELPAQSRSAAALACGADLGFFERSCANCGAYQDARRARRARLSGA